MSERDENIRGKKFETNIALFVNISIFKIILCLLNERQIKEDWTLEWTLFGDFSKLETTRNIKIWL